MRDTDTNWVLIGMPGAGKSTVGVLLAKRGARDFLDTDVLIQAREGRRLQAIVDTEGYLALRAIEERVLLDLDLRGHVIATGGSAPYSEAAMQHLKRHGRMIHLKTDADTLLARIGDYSARGLARRPDQTFADLYAERMALYERYADITVDAAAGSHEDVCEAILERMKP